MVRGLALSLFILIPVSAAQAQEEKFKKYSFEKDQVSLDLPETWKKVQQGKEDKLLEGQSPNQMIYLIFGAEVLDTPLKKYLGLWKSMYGKKVGLKERSTSVPKKSGDWLRGDYDGKNEGIDLRFIMVLHKKGKTVYRLLITTATMVWDTEKGTIERIVASFKDMNGDGAKVEEPKTPTFDPSKVSATVTLATKKTYDASVESGIVWATSAVDGPDVQKGASSKASNAIGKFDMWPRPGSSKVWRPKKTFANGSWLEVGFPATDVETIYIYAVRSVMALSRIEVLHGGKWYSVWSHKVTKEETLKENSPRVLTAVLTEVFPQATKFRFVWDHGPGANEGWPPMIDAIGVKQ